MGGLITRYYKVTYLKRLWEKTYISDVVERHKLNGVLTDDLTPYKDINWKGLYIFIVRYSDGVTKRSLE